MEAPLVAVLGGLTGMLSGLALAFLFIYYVLDPIAARVLGFAIFARSEKLAQKSRHQKAHIYDGNETVCTTCPRNSYGEYVAWDQAHPRRKAEGSGRI